MPSSFVAQTLQGAVLSVIANVLAQIIASYKYNVHFSLDLVPIVKFATFSIISNPPNIIWQTFLEDNFPTTVHEPPPKGSTSNGRPIPTNRTSKRNILIKFLLDQTFGAIVLNNLMFLVFMGYVNAPPAGYQGAWDFVVREVREKLLPVTLDGYKLWPIFSLVSFLWIPVDKRIVAGCLVNVGWNIYLSLMAGSQRVAVSNSI